MLLAAVPILVELFTSEGCSSCPPADAVLARLHEKQPVPGVTLLVMSEHVDYWNNLGWRDPYSASLFTDRQERYGPRMYTPQAVVDGRIDILGSDEAGIARAAKSASAEPHGTLSVSFVQNEKARPVGNGGAAGVPGVHLVHVAATGLPPHGPAQVLVAVVEDGLVSKVERGENEGRTLSHTAVVRALKPVAAVAKDAPAWSGDAEIPTDPAWKRTRVVVFVQDRESGRVVAAGSL